MLSRSCASRIASSSVTCGSALRSCRTLVAHPARTSQPDRLVTSAAFPPSSPASCRASEVRRSPPVSAGAEQRGRQQHDAQVGIALHNPLGASGFGEHAACRPMRRAGSAHPTSVCAANEIVRVHSVRGGPDAHVAGLFFNAATSSSQQPGNAAAGARRPAHPEFIERALRRTDCISSSSFRAPARNVRPDARFFTIAHRGREQHRIDLVEV